MDQVGQAVCLVPVAFKALSVTKRRTEDTSLSPGSVILVIPGKFKPCVLLKKTGSVQCKGKTSLESRRCRQNVLWEEPAEFLGWQWKRACSPGHPNPSIWQMSTRGCFVPPSKCHGSRDYFFFQMTWKTKQDIVFENQKPRGLHLL